MRDKEYYEQKALLYAEKYGVIEYEVEGREMNYSEEVKEGQEKYVVYKAKVNLDTMKEERTEEKRG